MRWLILLFIVVPLAEMMLLFEVADHIGGLWTIFLVMLTAVIGVHILKRQGLGTLLRVNQRLNSGQLPAQEIVEGVLLACAGVLLLTPGFITDSLGFSILVTPLRRQLAARIIRSGLIQAAGANAGSGFYFRSSGGFTMHDSRADGTNIYDGDFIEENRTLGHSIEENDQKNQN